MTLRALAALGIAAAAVFPGCRAEGNLESFPERNPAPVMAFEGAEWLERPTRAIEERPDIVLDAMDLRNGDMVAEIGSGTGYYARRLAKEVSPDGEVWAVDIQPEMLELMEDLAADEGIENIVPILGTETDPNLPTATFDWILIADVYHEMQEPQAMLRAIRAAVTDEGRIALVEYRLEGATAEHIRLEHRMSVTQILAEWLPAGFDLVDRIETLPSQHLLIFEKSE
ncbi:MAG: class I SAM-dependent methyltransferase [Acidobacteria bacterium]|nr:class I SAM-dependent methyltransferase [Acidobacteriota bacterium]